MNDKRPVTEVVAHLQAAALEVIAAFRAILDLAEEAVRDPAAVAAALARPRRRRDGDDGDGKGSGGRVQRIPVS